jgi:hypothetical protein
VAAFLATVCAAQVTERHDLNGAFVGEAMPRGWGPNKPGYWDEAGKVALTPIPDLEMNALRLTSATRAMHVYCATRFSATGGDRLVLTCLLRGEGAGSLGAYHYPAGGWLKREFSVTEEWSEFTAEFTLTKGVTHLSVVLGIPPCASVEFLDATAKLVRGTQ